MAGEEYQIRTDLALETQERIQKSKKNLRGIGFKEDERKNGITISTVSIETENASKTMGRPKGKYITIEAPQLSEDDTNYHREVSEEFSMVLRELMLEVGERISLKVKSGEWSILVVGLGNREVTADALGPRVVDNLFITRHILKEYGTYAFGSKIVNKISGIVPGVMAQTGMETSQIIKGIVSTTKPGVVIAIDALAARSVNHLNKTFQISDKGIHPGSGVGNHRAGITSESVGVPVIALGVPTVIEMNNMFVTPKDVDIVIRANADILSDSINSLVYSYET